ncbi:MAG: hypothetical protein U0X92_09385 [Anaerolineales bacterium]
MDKLLASYSRPRLDEAKEQALHTFMLTLAQKAGMATLPSLENVDKETSTQVNM